MLTELELDNWIEMYKRDFSRPDRVGPILMQAREAIALERRVREAMDELVNIAEANRYSREHFKDAAEFADWAQSRARHTLAKLATPT